MPDARWKVTELIRTAPGCPSQWDGKVRLGSDSKELYFYVRYRFGKLRIGAGRVEAEAVLGEKAGGVTIFEEQVDHERAGFMNFKRLKALTAHVVDYGDREVDDGAMVNQALPIAEELVARVSANGLTVEGVEMLSAEDIPGGALFVTMDKYLLLTRPGAVTLDEAMRRMTKP